MLVSFLALMSCFVVDNRNGPPYVVDAAAWVYFDGYYGDVWVFEAVVGDPVGLSEVMGVWADVYDGPILTESFELYPTNDPAYWTSEWLGYTTQLDPFWSYQVDFVVYDLSETVGVLTVWSESY